LGIEYTSQTVFHAVPTVEKMKCGRGDPNESGLTFHFLVCSLVLRDVVATNSPLAPEYQGEGGSIQEIGGREGEPRSPQIQKAISPCASILMTGWDGWC